MLRVKVLQAKGLRAGDKGGTSDPYCIVTCGKVKAKGGKKKTKVVKKTLTPTWDEEFECGDAKHGVSQTGTDELVLQVKDSDFLKDDVFFTTQNTESSKL